MTTLNRLKTFPEIIIMQALPLYSVILVLRIFTAKAPIRHSAQEQRYESDQFSGAWIPEALFSSNVEPLYFLWNDFKNHKL